MPDALTLDLSDLPKQQAALLQLDLSDLPKASQPIASYAGEDKGSQLSSCNPDSWLQDEIPAAPAQPLFASVPRPPERLYRENAPQILQDIWDAASPKPTVGPLREHPVRPDVRQALWTLFKEQALPNEPAGIVENMEAGLRQASAHLAANVISLIGSPMDENGGPTRAEQYNSVYKAIYKTILPDNLAPPQDFTDSLARGVGEAAPNLVETMLLSYATGGALNPLFEGMAAKFPTLAAKLFPIARDALTFGTQGGLEPEQAGRQAAIGTGVGAILGTLSPYSRLARIICGASVGAGQEYLTDPNATAQDYARSATLMGAFVGLAATHGLTVAETIGGTLLDWAKTKGYTPEEIGRALQTQGIRPVLNEFAEDMTAPQMENRSGAVAGIRPGEQIDTIEHPIETIPDPNKTEHGGQSLEQSRRFLRTLYDRFGDRGKAVAAYDSEAANKYFADNPEAKIEDTPNYLAYVKPVLDAAEKFGTGGEPGPGITSTRVWERREGAVPPDEYARVIAGTQEPVGGEQQGEYVKLAETPEFKNWFGDSKVVFREGESDPFRNPEGIAGIPKMVYHGTPERQSSDLFRPNEKGVVLFTTSQEVALQTAGKGGEIIPAYLKIENPLIIKTSGAYFIEDAAIDKAKALGNDGVIIEAPYRSYTYAVFSPDQVKSPLTQGIFNLRDTGALHEAYQYTIVGQFFQKIKEALVEIIGLPVESYVDLAVLAQGWRNPNYEETRYVYVRDGIIVDHEGVTCRLPMMSHGFLGDTLEGIQHIKERIAALGADSLYPVHNHPTGNLEVSADDLVLTVFIANHVPEMKGHIIINGRQYGFIEPNGKYETYDLPGLPEKWIDPILTPSVPHEMLDKAFRPPWDIAAWAKALTAERNRPLIVYLNPRFKVRGLQEINPGGTLDWKQVADVMPKKLVDFGSAHSVLILPERSRGYMLEMGESLVRQGVFYDVVSIDKDGPHSVLEIGTNVEKERFGGRPLTDFPAQPIR